MPWSEERTRRVCSKIGRAFLGVAAVTVVAGLLSVALLDAGRAGDGIVVSGVCYGLGGLSFRPATWERLSIPFLPQRTPMAGILLTVAATGTLWTVSIRPLLVG